MKSTEAIMAKHGVFDTLINIVWCKVPKKGVFSDMHLVAKKVL